MLQLMKATDAQTQKPQEAEAQLQVMKKGVDRAERADIQEVIKFVVDEQKAYDLYRNACEEVYKQAQSKHTGIKISTLR